MGAAGSWGQVGEGARRLGGSKACAQPQRRRHRALPKALPSAAGPSMQGENALPGSPCFCPGPRPAQPPQVCTLTARPGCTGAALPAGAPDSRPHCDSSPVMSQAPEHIRGTPAGQPRPSAPPRLSDSQLPRAAKALTPTKYRPTRQDRAARGSLYKATEAPRTLTKHKIG